MILQVGNNLRAWARIPPYRDLGIWVIAMTHSGSRLCLCGSKARVINPKPQTLNNKP